MSLKSVLSDWKEGAEIYSTVSRNQAQLEAVVNRMLERYPANDQCVVYSVERTMEDADGEFGVIRINYRLR